MIRIFYYRVEFRLLFLIEIVFLFHSFTDELVSILLLLLNIKSE